MININTLCENAYLHQKNEDLILSFAQENSYVVAQNFYFAMVDPNTIIVIPKIYWDTYKIVYPYSIKIIDYFLTSVGYEISPSFYELEHDDYNNKKFMIESGFVENLDLLDIVNIVD